VLGYDTVQAYSLDNIPDTVGMDGSFSAGVCGPRKVEMYSPSLGGFHVTAGPDASVDPFFVEFTEPITQNYLGDHTLVVLVWLEEYPNVAPLNINLTLSVICPDMPSSYFVNQTQISTTMQDILYSTNDGLKRVIPMPQVFFEPSECFQPSWTFRDLDQNAVTVDSTAYTFDGTSITIESTDTTLSGENLYAVELSFDNGASIVYEFPVKVTFISADPCQNTVLEAYDFVLPDIFYGEISLNDTVSVPNFADSVAISGSHSFGVCGARIFEAFSPTFKNFKIVAGADASKDNFTLGLTALPTEDMIGTHYFVGEVRLADYPTVQPLVFEFTVTVNCPSWPLEFYIDTTVIPDMFVTTTAANIQTIYLPQFDYAPRACFVPRWTIQDFSTQNAVSATSGVFNVSQYMIEIDTANANLAGSNLYIVKLRFEGLTEVYYDFSI